MQRTQPNRAADMFNARVSSASRPSRVHLEAERLPTSRRTTCATGTPDTRNNLSAMSQDADDPDFAALAECRRAMNEVAQLRYSRLIQATRTDSPILFYQRVSIDDYGVVTVGEWGGYLLQMQPMSYWDRLVMTPLSSPLTYDYGWDFPRGAHAIHAALRWNPQRQAEPEGYERRIGSKRMPGQHHASALPGDRFLSVSEIVQRGRSSREHRPKG